MEYDFILLGYKKEIWIIILEHFIREILKYKFEKKLILNKITQITKITNVQILPNTQIRNLSSLY